MTGHHLQPQSKLGAVVTGAAKGIGLGVARTLAQRGYVVTILDIDAEAGETAVEALRAERLEAHFEIFDVSRSRDAISILAAIDARHPLEVLVNNAGILRSHATIDVTHDDFDEIFSINVRGLFFMMQAAARIMIARGGGSIVNVSSTAAFRPATILPQPIYSASKAAVSMLTVAAARELAPHRIRVNAVAPSAVETPMTRAMAPPEAFTAHVRENVPLGRAGTPQDIGEAVAWLVSAEASFVVGHTLVVDGGRLT